AHMNPDEIFPIAGGLADVLENAQKYHDLPRLGTTLAALAAHMEPEKSSTVAARGAHVLAEVLENVREDQPLSRLGTALAALGGHMDAARSSAVAARGATVLAAVLEDPDLIDPDSRRLSALGIKRQKTDPNVLSSQGAALAAL